MKLACADGDRPYRLRLRTIPILATLVFAIAALPGCGPKEHLLTEDQKRLNVESFDQVWTTIRDKHFDPDLGGLDWPGIRDELRPKVVQAQTMSESRAGP